MNKNVIILLTLVVLFSCKKDENSEPRIVGPSYFPLHIGDYWEYVFFVSEDQARMTTVTIPSKANINGQEYYLMVSKYNYSETNTEIDSTYYRIDAMGFVFKRKPNSLEEINPFRLNAGEGETWTLHNTAIEDYVVTAADSGTVELDVIVKT